MVETTILVRIGFLAVLIAGGMSVADAILIQSREQASQLVPVVLIGVGGLLLVGIGALGLAQAALGSLGDTVEAIPTVTSGAWPGQLLAIGISILLLLVVIPKAYLGIEGSPILQELSDRFLS